MKPLSHTYTLYKRIPTFFKVKGQKKFNKLERKRIFFKKKKKKTKSVYHTSKRITITKPKIDYAFHVSHTIGQLLKTMTII